MHLSKLKQLLITIFMAYVCISLQACQHSHDVAIAKTSTNLSPALSTILSSKQPNFSSQAKEAALELSNNKLILDIQTSGLKSHHQQAITDTGAIIVGFFPQYERISAHISSKDTLIKLQQLPFIRYISEEHGTSKSQSKS